MAEQEGDQRWLAQIQGLNERLHDKSDLYTYMRDSLVSGPIVLTPPSFL